MTNIFNNLKNESSFWEKMGQIGSKVSILKILLLLFFLIGPNFKEKYRDFRRKLRAVSLPETPYFNDDSDLPTIEVTIDSCEKDLEILHYVIAYAIKNVKNPISKVSVVVPRNCFDKASQIVTCFKSQVSIVVISEETILSEDLIFQIKKTFPLRHGWILHQFLTLQQVLKSENNGILSIDSDTMILRPMAFVDGKGIQVLMESLEYHRPYYEFLHKVNVKYPVVTPTHVTHYSFFQRDIMIACLRYSNVLGIDDLAELVFKYADNRKLSAICIDRELYAIGMRILFPKRFTLTKFANRNVSRQNLPNEKAIDAFSRHYNSISAHSYLVGK